MLLLVKQLHALLTVEIRQNVRPRWPTKRLAAIGRKVTLMVTVPEPNTWDASRLLLTAARIVQRRQNEALASLGLTHAAVIALAAVAPGPTSQKQLAVKVGIRSQSMGRMIARLESGGLLTRARNPNDRRQFLVRITVAGNAALESAVEVERLFLPRDIDGWDSLRDLLVRFVESS